MSTMGNSTERPLPLDFAVAMMDLKANERGKIEEIAGHKRVSGNQARSMIAADGLVISVEKGQKKDYLKQMSRKTQDEHTM